MLDRLETLPRLRDHVRRLRERHGSKRWVMAEDPAVGKE